MGTKKKTIWHMTMYGKGVVRRIHGIKSVYICMKDVGEQYA